MENKKKNNITELVFILDKSGSMAGLESDTIGGFNAMIEKQKKLDSACYVSTVLFSSVSEVIHDRQKLGEIGPLTERDYQVGGCTALIDAIGGAIRHIGRLHKYFGESAPGKTIFVITTDGMENSSRKYGSEEVKKMIERHKKEHGWEFLFIGANIDAVETAAQIGISRDRAVKYSASSKGTQTLYETLSAPISATRSGEDIDACFSIFRETNSVE